MGLKLHPLAGGTSTNLIKLLSTYPVEAKYLPKLMPAAALTFLGAPGRQVNRLRFGPQVDALEFEADPIFILGHWRSGTTYLHHLMSLDDSFSYVTSYQAWAPEEFLNDAFTTRFLVKQSLPKKRPMDNVEMFLKNPEEEEFVLANVSPYSFIHIFYFPQDALEIFRKAVLFEGIPEADKACWEETYVRVLKTAAFSMDGKRVLAKSPGNTARIKTLLKLFPNAKFVHIYRNPYTVFASFKHTCKKLTELWKLQDFDLERVEDYILPIYQKVMDRYFEYSAFIPSGNLVEVCYEDFEANPIEGLKQVYDQLSLPDFEPTRQKIEDYIAAQPTYKKNSYNLDQSTLDRVYRHWHFTIEKWGYSHCLSLAP